MFICNEDFDSSDGKKITLNWNIYAMQTMHVVSFILIGIGIFLDANYLKAHIIVVLYLTSALGYVIIIMNS